MTKAKAKTEPPDETPPDETPPEENPPEESPPEEQGYVDAGPVPPPPPPPEPAPVLGSRTITPSPPEYLVGAVKQDPETLAVAVRTNILDPENRKDWGIMSIDRGGMYVGWDQVSSWPDLAGVTRQGEEAAE
jgi:hypothetical protein